MDTFQQHRRGFVVRVLGDQFAAKGLGEQRRCQAFDLGAGGGVASFEAVGVGEEGFDTADDFVLLWPMSGNWNRECGYIFTSVNLTGLFR